MNDNNWASLQELLKKTSVASATASEKEEEVKKQLFKLLQEYYKYKKQNQLKCQNNLNIMGLSINKDIKTKITVKIITSKSSNNDLNYYITIKEFLLEYRNNPELLVDFANKLDSQDQYVIANVFTHFFFEDIKREFSHKFEKTIDAFIRDHIQTISNICFDDFLSHNTFTGKLILEFSKINEVKVYLAYIFSDLMNQFFIKSKSEKSYLSFDYDNISEMIAIEGNQNLDFLNGIVNSINQLRRSERLGESKMNLYSSLRIESKSSQKYTSLEETDEIKLKNEFSKGNFFEREMKRKLKNANESYDKIFLINHLRNIDMKEKEDLYAKSVFFNNVIIKNNSIKFMRRYLAHVELVKSFITKLIIAIKNTLNFMPQIIKHTAYYISFYLREKYENIEFYELQSFIRKYFIEKIIIPTLIKPERNELIAPQFFFTESMHKSLETIATVLAHISRGQMFDKYNNIEFLVFNDFIYEQNSTLYEIAKNILTEGENEDVCNFEQEHQNENEVYQIMCLSKSEIEIFKGKYTLFKDRFNPKKYYDSMLNIDLDKKSNNNNNSNKNKKDNEEDAFRFYLFIQENFEEERNRVLNIEKQKEKISLKASTTNAVKEVKMCINHVLCNVPELNANKNYNVLSLFESLDKIINYHDTDYSNITKTSIPISWYSNFIINHIKLIPNEYQINNYDLLYKEITKETEDKLNKYYSKIELLTIDMTKELRAIKKLVSLAKNQYENLKQKETTIQAFYFINIAKIPICLITETEKYDIVSSKGKNNSQSDKENSNKLILSAQNDCVHREYSKIGALANNFGFTENYKKKNEMDSTIAHCQCINDFIQRVSTYGRNISIDILNKIKKMKTHEVKEKDNNETNANQVVEYYIDSISNYFTRAPKIKNLFTLFDEKKQSSVIEIIRTYILSNISNSLQVIIDLKREDKKFETKCIESQWLDLYEHLEVNPLLISDIQLDIAKSFILKMDEQNYCNKIIEMFSKAVEIIVKMINFTISKPDSSVDDFIPILCYLIIKAKPKKMISNFGNCVYFMNEKKLNDNLGFTLANIQVCINFIQNLKKEQIKKNFSGKDYIL